MSFVFKSVASKLTEKMKESDQNIQKKLVGSFAKNERLATIMEVSAEHWPIIDDLQQDPRKRMLELDSLIHSTAVFSGRIKQNPIYGEMMSFWERAYGYWQNYAVLEMENIMPPQFAPTMEIPLKDGTVLVVRDKDSGSVLSKKENNLRLTLFANVDFIPRGKKVWVYGVSDDKDVSEQYALFMQAGQQMGQQMQQPSMIPTQQLGSNQPRPTRQSGQYSPRNPTT